MPTGTGISDLNYATAYSRALANAFPYQLYFGALYATENNNRYRWVDSKTIAIPSIKTTGRTAADRDSIAQAARNYDNAWENKTLENERKWSTLVHPRDIDETNYVASIANITQAFNEFQKFPEMDAYTASKLFAEWGTTTDPETGTYRVADDTELTVENILGVFDALMLKMDNERVPSSGRILYVTHEVNYILKEAEKISRSLDISSGPNAIDRRINRLDQVEIVGVPKELMKTAYVFTEGFVAAENAKQINLLLVHPTAVITPVSYTFASLDTPSAITNGKYYYYEESFEDVFILNKQAGAIQFNVTDDPAAAPAIPGTGDNDGQGG